MQEIIQKLNDLISLCQARIQKADEERNHWASQKAIADAQQAKNTDKEKELNAREEICNDKEAHYLKVEELIAAQGAHDNKVSQFIEQHAKSKRELDELQKRLDDQKSSNEIWHKKLIEMQAELDLKITKYREQVMSAIVKDLAARGINLDK